MASVTPLKNESDDMPKPLFPILCVVTRGLGVGQLTLALYQFQQFLRY